MVLRPDQIQLERPYPFAEVDMREEALCTDCGVESYPWPARELMTIAHRHPKRPEGHWRIYCPEHFAERPEPGEDGYIPELAPKAPKAPKRRTAAPRASARSADGAADAASPRAARAAAPKAPARRGVEDEKPMPVCPNCFVSVSLTGVCSICGEAIEL